ncbi:MAG: YVTN family beta-propeller protein [Paraglaciecola sp.]
MQVTPDGNRAYVSSIQTEDSIPVVDLTTNTPIEIVSTGQLLPQGIGMTNDGAFVYVPNRDSNTVTVLDTTNNTVVANIPVGFRPGLPAFSPDGLTVYQPNRAIRDLSVIDIATQQVVDVFDTGVNGHIWAAITPSGDFLYLANQDSDVVTVYDIPNRMVAATIPVGEYPIGIAVKPALISEPAPTADSVRPETVIAATPQLNQTLSCSGFTQNTIVELINENGDVNGEGVDITRVTFRSETSLRLLVRAKGNATIGFRTLRVTNSDGQSSELSEAFEVIAP